MTDRCNKPNMSKSKIRDVNPRLLSQSLKDRLLVEVAHRCCICPEHEDITEIHHIVAVGKGGSSNYENLIVLCPNCHAKVHREKGKYTPAQLKMYKTKWIKKSKSEGKSSGASTALIPEIDVKQINTEKIDVKLIIHSLGQTWDVQLPWDIRTADVAQHLSQKLGVEGVRILNRYHDWELMTDNRVLDNNRTLRENGVKPGCTLYLCVRVCLGGPEKLCKEYKDD